jgi:hypothetical protein
MSQLCHQLHTLLSQRPRLNFSFGSADVPRNGIYVVFESGEFGHGTDRIVRIGTHIGDGRLYSRLTQHFVKENKDRSIFRKNIGRALLKRNHDTFFDQWQLDLTSRAAKQKYLDGIDKGKLKATESLVTGYTTKYFSFAVFPVERKTDRLDWESKMISTVSLCRECNSSENWLGSFSPISKIRNSGLWLVNELYKDPLDEAEIKTLMKLVSEPFDSRSAENSPIALRSN